MEERNKAGVERRDIADGLEGIGGRMLAEPEFHEGHENLVAAEEGVVEVEGLPVPLLPEFRGDTIDEDSELVKLLFRASTIEEIEVGIVENLPLLGPHAVL